jgi:hypothetical protein
MSTGSQRITNIDAEISSDCAQYYDDPLGWVLWAFPWGEPGTILEDFDGPDDWQITLLQQWGDEIKDRGFDGFTPCDPIQFGIASGHGIGKSALSGWIILFIMSTRPHSKGVVTANTGDQLRTKTWGELGKWRKICMTGHWFEYNNGRNSMSIYRHGHSETWRVDAQTCREENSESFAGLHCANSTPWYLFDEGSAIPDKIYEVAEGGKTDGEPMHFVFGNPTRNSGMFHDIFNGEIKKRWKLAQIDSRTAKMTNKKQIEIWRQDWGEDSDFFRVRVLGRFPKAGDMQYIPNDVVHTAQKIDVRYYPDDPLICGIDCARGGDDNAMIQFRRGFDARSEMAYRIPGEKIRDSMKFVSKVTDVLHRHKPDVVFVDSGAMGGPIGDRLRQLGYNAVDVGFGEKAADDRQYVNRTAEMWSRMRNWLFAGGAVKDNPQLEKELTDREYSHNDKDQLMMERKKDMKKRGLASPDWADALCLTFAEHVPKKTVPNNDIHTMRGKPVKKVARNVLDRLDS